MQIDAIISQSDQTGNTTELGVSRRLWRGGFYHRLEMAERIATK